MSNNPFMPNQSPAPMPGAYSTPAPAAAPMPGNSAAAGADAFEVDLSNVQNNFVIPDGLYRVKCIEIEQDVSKGGNPMFKWTFEVSAGEHAGFQSKVFTAITPAAMWKVAETVQALGVGQTGQVVKFKRSDVLNKECGALIEKTEYNGQERSQISRVMTLQDMAAAQNAG